MITVTVPTSTHGPVQIGAAPSLCPGLAITPELTATRAALAGRCLFGGAL